MSANTPTGDRDYVLGTHDEEIARLGLQHRVWRPRALDAWQRAGFAKGQTLLDIGCGPGWASLDLAEIVGPTGRVLAIDRSRRFLDALSATCRSQGLDQITTHELDLDENSLPTVGADGAWGRWVFAFVRQPRQLLEHVHAALRPGGVLVLHEYFDYSTWRMAPPNADIEEFVRVVIESWRDSGGEPDIALNMPAWLAETGFDVKSLNPIVDVVASSSGVWQWLKTFIHVGVRRLADLGFLTTARADEIVASFATAEAEPSTLMISPGVLEIIAVRR